MSTATTASVPIKRANDRLGAIRASIDEELREVFDAEGRSRVDFLINRLQSLRQPDVDWLAATVRSARTSIAAPARKGWWSAFERLVVLGGLQSRELGHTLEEALSARRIVDADDRASIYSILDVCGMPQSLALIGADLELKSLRPLRWLDLVIARTPREEDAQALVLEAARAGNFALENFIQRLNAMRSLGGARLGEWIRRYRAILSPEDQSKFDLIVDEAFGPFASAHDDQWGNVTSDPELLSVRTLALLEPSVASLPIGLALKKWQPRRIRPSTRGEVKTALALLQKAISYNHSSLVQYLYLSSQKHKILKDAMRLKRKKIANIRDHSASLLNFLNRQFYEAAHKNFEFLHAYFSTKGELPPRICLKGNFRLDESDQIVSIFRDHPIDYESDVDIRKNTGFHSIQMTGKYFIENNIPAAALRGDYVNPRLNTEKIQADYKKPTVKNVRALTERWGSYWRDEHPSGDPSLYKSTLIHPLTLWDNEISNEFKSSVDIENVDRSIFGFLCFDHRTVDYFEESSDSFVAKIFADILCTYIFIRMVYTDLSHTFSAVLDLLGKKNLKLNIHKIGQIRQPRAPDTIGSFLGQPAGIPDTPNLVVTDKVLLDFIKRTTDTGRVSKRQARPS